MKNIDSEYEQYIRFYLDTTIVPKESKENVTYYYTNPSKKFVSFIKKASGKEDYLLSYPMSAAWNLTSACNLRCVHCLYNDTGYNNTNDLSTEQALKLADELINDFGITYVMLTGGEIFTRKDTLDIIRRFKKNNVGVRLLTNAALLEDEQIDEIAELFNPYTDSMHISLDGATNETFKKIRRTDLFGKITQNIKKLTDKKVRVNAVCTVNKINYSEVVDTYKLSKDLGIYCFIVGRVAYYNNSHTDLIVSNRDLFKLYYELMQNEYLAEPLLSANFWTPAEVFNIPEVREIAKESYYQDLINLHHKKIKSVSCQYHDKIAIQSDGTIYLCLEALAYNMAPLGSFKENSLKEIWENRWDNMLFKPRKIENMKCKNCKYNVYCNSGCPVKAYFASGDVNAPQVPSCQPF